MPNGPLNILLWLIVAAVIIVVLFKWFLPAIFGSDSDAALQILAALR